MRKSGQTTSRTRLAIAFITGMALTALLAQTPAIADILSPQPAREPAVPVAPLPAPYQPGANLDTGKPIIIELVYILPGQAELNRPADCLRGGRPAI